MKPKNSSYNSGCVNGTSSKCVEWVGPSITCLDICTGDSLTDVTHAIATKVCDIATGLDLSTIDLHCLLDLCSDCPSNYDIKTIIQLILDNQCGLKTLIDDIITAINSAGTGGAVVLNLNMRCLTVYDSFNNPVPQDLNQTLQSIIDRICNVIIPELAEHATTLVDHENRIETLESSSGGGSGSGYTEPVMNLCTSTVPKLLHLAVQDLANDYCGYKVVVGTIANINTTVSRQCGDLNTTYGLTAGWLMSPTTFADTVNNMWIAVCDVLTRVKTIETTCCAPTCDSVIVGFTATSSADNPNIATIKFSSAAGTKIPASFEDSGNSTITFTDSGNVVLEFPIEITNNSTNDFDLSGLDFSENISITVSASFQTIDGSLTCEKCTGRVFKMAIGTCPFCMLTTSGTSGTVTISYTTPDNLGQVQSLVIAFAGTSFIPSNAQILSIISTGTASLNDQDCIDMTPQPSVCYEFDWLSPVDDLRNDGDVDGAIADNIISKYEGIMLGSTLYKFKTSGGTDRVYSDRVIVDLSGDYCLDNCNGDPENFNSASAIADGITHMNNFIQVVCHTQSLVNQTTAPDPVPYFGDNKLIISIPASLAGNTAPFFRIKTTDPDTNVIGYRYVMATLSTSCTC